MEKPWTVWPPQSGPCRPSVAWTCATPTIIPACFPLSPASQPSSKSKPCHWEPTASTMKPCRH
eukprot:56354-Eustigmatos_ZCMA.PRE.1